MRAILAIAFLFFTLSARADAKDDALVAAGADCITSGSALAFGFSEANPFGPVAACALKPALISLVADQPEPQRTTSLQAMNAAWTGAAVHNVMAMVGAGAAAPVFGVMLAIGVWASGEEEREFARLCAVHEKLAGHPMKCHYTPSRQKE